MADELQSGICGGNLWSTPRRRSLGTSPCSAVLSDMGSYGWSTDLQMMVMKQARSATSDDDDDQSASVCDNSIMGFQDIIHKPHPVDSGGVLMDSTLQMLGFGLSSSSPTSDWNNQTLLHGEKSENNYNSMLQDEMTNSRLQNYRQEERSTAVDCHQIQTGWTSKNFAAIADEDSTIVTCQGLPTSSFSMESANNSYIYPSSIVQSLFEPDPDEPQPQQSVFDNYQSSANFRTISNDFSSSWPKSSPNFRKLSTPKQQPANHLQFSNNTPFWNAATAASILSPQHSQFFNPTFEEKPNCANLTAKPNSELKVSMAKKISNEPAFKRPRIETPSPLPTFKVRKEKLGDRITALQQLVSPFGKTDTASVLHEAIEYIKFLHDQVSVLSTPYMKNVAHNVQHQQTSHKLKDSEGTEQDLNSRGLCLVPISSTYPVANETTSDFWTPTFGGTFR